MGRPKKVLEMPTMEATTETATKEAKTERAAKKGPIELPELKRGLFRAYIIGDSPLIVHAWGRKALIEMLAKHMGQPLPRFPKSPVQDFLNSLYRMDDNGYGFPANGFKKCLVTSCTSMNKEINQTVTRQAFTVKGEIGYQQSAFAGLKTPMPLFRVHSPEPPHIREDAVKLNGKLPDLRYRAEFWPWAMIVDLSYNQRLVTQATIAALIDTAGFAVGLGEWRQEKNGINGTFRLADPTERAMVDKWAALPHQEPFLPDEKQFLAELTEAVRKYGVLQEDEQEENIVSDMLGVGKGGNGSRRRARP